jgi:hypothetical protein
MAVQMLSPRGSREKEQGKSLELRFILETLEKE